MLSEKYSINDIKELVAPEMVLFEKKFKASLKSDVSLLDRITHYIVKRKGKQMRPMFVFLTSKLIGSVNEKTYVAASLIELIHTATLVHDDVVDDADKRRGFFSINALWKNKIAVLVGDYLLSKGLVLSIENDYFDLLKHISVAVKEMSEGELLQMEKARKLDITEEVYYRIIRKKTATLISTCCASGASSVTDDQELVKKMWEFGDYVGMAFQIKDDLFDYGGGLDIGKPTGIDIKEKKMTLPLIAALKEASDKDRKRILKLVKHKNKKNAAVKEVIQFVLESNGIQYAYNKMLEFQQKALAILDEFPDNEAKKALIGLVNYTVERKK